MKWHCDRHFDLIFSFVIGKRSETNCGTTPIYERFVSGPNSNKLFHVIFSWILFVCHASLIKPVDTTVLSRFSFLRCTFLLHKWQHTCPWRLVCFACILIPPVFIVVVVGTVVEVTTRDRANCRFGLGEERKFWQMSILFINKNESRRDGVVLGINCLLLIQINIESFKVTGFCFMVDGAIDGLPRVGEWSGGIIRLESVSPTLLYTGAQKTK